MPHALTNPVHTFHIPVMGTGFTIDTPVKVARFGISSVVSLVDDVLIEQMRRHLCRGSGLDYREITEEDDDPRAHRITSYLDTMDQIVETQMERLRRALFEKGSEITRYFEMLPDSPLRGLYEKMLAITDPQERARLQDVLREKVRPGAIDVNIMTKLDRDNFRKGKALPPIFADAMSALRGYANSRVQSSIILSAGLNRRLFSYLAEFKDFFPDGTGEFRKRIILKVADYRSALLQGKILTRQGLWVSEFRVESGLNCGGHAFDSHGSLLGPVLEEFRREKGSLTAQLRELWLRALQEMGRSAPATLPEIRVTVQGGIGTAEERSLLERQYQVDGTGWGSPFLLCPEAVNVDPVHVERILAAGEDDVHLSNSSPLGVPFWCLKTSASEDARLRRIAEGRPGSACPKGFLAFNSEFTNAPICTASRAYQRRKLQALDEGGLAPRELQDQKDEVVAKACICHDLAGGATITAGIDPHATTAVCCGPNTVYFERTASLQEMTDHIYGRRALPLAAHRPHMFLKEISLHLDRLRQSAADKRQDMTLAARKSASQIRGNLLEGIRHYRERVAQLAAGRPEEFLARLEKLRSDLDAIPMQPDPAEAAPERPLVTADR